MSRTHAAFLALLVSALLAIGVPMAYALWQMMLERIAGIGQFRYSVLIACIAAPIWYVVFRRLK